MTTRKAAKATQNMPVSKFIGKSPHCFPGGLVSVPNNFLRHPLHVLLYGREVGRKEGGAIFDYL